jgi:2-iminobutanoate/2-iminopropanoate deaminase
MKTKLTAFLFFASFTIIYAQTKVSYIQTQESPKQGLPFSQAVQMENILYVSGQIGVSGTSLVPGGIIPETKQIMENIKGILEQNGSSMDKVIKCTCMLADISELTAMNSEYVKYFPTHKPARSAFGTSGLTRGARVEIECMAYVK